jgi:hypothetical protein
MSYGAGGYLGRENVIRATRGITVQMARASRVEMTRRMLYRWRVTNAEQMARARRVKSIGKFFIF